MQLVGLQQHLVAVALRAAEGARLRGAAVLLAPLLPLPLLAAPSAPLPQRLPQLLLTTLALLALLHAMGLLLLLLALLLVGAWVGQPVHDTDPKGMDHDAALLVVADAHGEGIPVGVAGRQAQGPTPGVQDKHGHRRVGRRLGNAHRDTLHTRHRRQKHSDARVGVQHIHGARICKRQ